MLLNNDTADTATNTNGANGADDRAMTCRPEIFPFGECLVPFLFPNTTCAAFSFWRASKSVDWISDEASGSYDEAAGRWTSYVAGLIPPVLDK